MANHEHEFDPQLHLIRSAVRSLQRVDARAAHEMEGARFNVFAALEGNDTERALRWLRSLEVAARAAFTHNDPAQVSAEVLAAIAEIREGLTNEDLQ